MGTNEDTSTNPSGNGHILPKTHFAVEVHERNGRPIYFLGIEAHEHRWREWLLPKEPPLKSGIRRIAIDRGSRDQVGSPPEAWDKGMCTLEHVDEDEWIVQFGGRKLFGHYVLLHTRNDHWLLFQGAARPERGIQFALSAGGIVIRQSDARPEVALIRPHGRRYWTLPKGTVEASEELPEAAIREVAEETGVEATIRAALDPIEYWFWSREGDRKVRVHKAVAYYLMSAGHEGEPTATEEVAEVRWFDLEEAPNRITHRSEREVLRQGAAAWARERESP